MKTRGYALRAVLALLAVAALLGACGTPPVPAGCTAGAPDRTKGCDEFTAWSSVVTKNGSAHAASGLYPFQSGDTLTTDTSGEAELNFSECWDGRIFIFKNSAGAFHVERCDEAEHNSASANCIPFGNWYVGKCAGEFDVVWTGSARIEKVGTSLSATYLPGQRQTTLVVVLEGEVQVEPVDTFQPLELAAGQGVAPGWFYFTMPRDLLGDIAGLPPRQTHPVDQLGPVAQELGIVDWMLEVRDRAAADGVLPPNWPVELGGEGISTGTGPEQPPVEGLAVSAGGGPLADVRVQEALYRAVDWQAVSDAVDGAVTVFIPGAEPLDALSAFPRDPDRAMALLAEAGYEYGQPVTLLFPADDPPLEKVLQLVARDLGTIKVAVAPESVPVEQTQEPLEVMPARMAERMRLLEQEGMGVIALWR